MALFWPLGAIFAAIGARRYLLTLRQAPNGLGEFLDMYRLALRENIPPIEYAMYRLNEAHHRRRRHRYIYWNDLPALAAINARRGAINDDVQDKGRFADICAARGYAHAATLAIFDRKSQIFPASQFRPTAPLLWSKALRLRAGAGAQKWVRDGEGYRNEDGQIVPLASLADALRDKDTIVQPFLENHPTIARLTNGFLATLRIVTGMDGDASAAFVTALLALPVGSSLTSIGGIKCSIASESGRVARAIEQEGQTIARHPDTDEPLIGFEVPFWHESLALVRRAHAQAFPRFAFLGWDVAITAEGPVLLEANSGWGALDHQRLDGPLGDTEFGRLVAQHV